MLGDESTGLEFGHASFMVRCMWMRVWGDACVGRNVCIPLSIEIAEMSLSLSLSMRAFTYMLPDVICGNQVPEFQCIV